MGDFGAHLVHGVAEADVGVEVGVAEGAAGAWVAEGSGIGTPGGGFSGERPAEAEAGIDADAGVWAIGLLFDASLDGLGIEEVDAVDLTAVGRGAVDAGEGAPASTAPRWRVRWRRGSRRLASRVGRPWRGRRD